MALFYADSSALVKLVRDEPESQALRTFISDADLVSCELVLTEVPRAIRRAASHDPRLPLETLIERAGELLDALALLPADRTLLAAAGAVAEPALRALDAIHVTAAVELSPLEAFVSYDERQAATARLAGLRTVRPGGVSRGSPRAFGADYRPGICSCSGMRRDTRSSGPTSAVTAVRP